MNEWDGTGEPEGWFRNPRTVYPIMTVYDWSSMRVWLDELSYKPGWTLQLFSGWPGSAGPGTRPHLRCRVETLDSVTGQPTVINHSMPLPLGPSSDRGEFHRAVLWAVASVEAHEAMEWLTASGDRVVNPHPEQTVVLYNVPA